MRLEEEEIEETYGVVVDSHLYDSYLTISEAEELIEELGKGDHHFSFWL